MKHLLIITLFVITKTIVAEKASLCPAAYSTCNHGIDGMINVHIVPHTHDDVGWLKTVDQYYYGSNTKNQQAAVQYILDNVIEELAKNPERRFVYVEIAFFWRWWNEQNDDTKGLVRLLVNEGRLEFVIGGWCMNDEATTYYQDIIDQQTLGLQFILTEFGECARPKVAWQLDPFGHSREQASLFSQFGFDGLFLGRLDYQDNDYRAATKTREFVWKSSGNLGENATMFTGILPNTYGPPSGLCFDDKCDDDPVMDNPNYEDYNVDEKVNQLLSYAKGTRNVYKTNNVIATMGSDFQYANAHTWFKNLDKLIYYVNQRQNETKVNAFYSTPSCYLYSLYNSHESWPTKDDDFFPYAHKPHAFWTGYFTSRTTLKNYVRKTNNHLQAVRQLSAITELYSDSVRQSLFSLDDAMGIAQHHDAVSGTERQHVAKDYAKRLSIGTENTKSIISDAYAKIISTNGEKLPTQYLCPLLNISECLPIENKNTFTIIIYNPIARESETWIRIPVSDPAYTVKDANTGMAIESEVSEIYAETKLIPERSANTDYELLFRIVLAPLGIQVFNITKSTFYNKMPNKENDLKAQEFQLVNQNLQLSFNADGELQQISTFDAKNIDTNMKQSFCYYDSFVGINGLPDLQSSGAYIFRPQTQKPTCSKVQKYTVKKSGLVQEVHQIFDDWISQTIRLYDNATSVEFEWQIGPIPLNLIIGKEVITYFESDLQSNGTFYTDANGREMLKRVRDYRPSWPHFNQTEPVSGNYYPINSRIFIRDEYADVTSRQLTLVTDRSHGGSSIQDGCMEIMLHRRLLMDDSLGVTEPLDELGSNLHGLIAKGKYYLFFNSSQTSARLHRDKAHKINMPPLITFINSTENSSDLFKSLNKFKSLRTSLPENVELLTLVNDFNTYSPGINALIVRFEHFYEYNEDFDLSQEVSFDLRELFNSTLNVINYEELALGANMNVSELQNRLKWTYNDITKTEKNAKLQKNKTEVSFIITLQPMQIRTFRVFCVPNSN